MHTVMTKNAFAEAVLALRQSAELTQERFAKLVGASRVTVSHWETGATLPNYPEYKLRNIKNKLKQSMH